MKRVLFFGTFDPLHLGHRKAIEYAKQLGDHLTVIVARDSTIVSVKKRAPFMDEHGRLAAASADTNVDEALLGDSDLSSYALLESISFDILALGYDQMPSDEKVEELLQKRGIAYTSIVRLQSFAPQSFKSSLFRPS
ncbi:MAG: adenylyltransferase/cytidyltransferase family protein [Patescibacteria group bacterium]